LALGAARDGVQAVHRLREGLVVVDIPAAQRRAQTYLAVAGASGSASATEEAVTVTVSLAVSPILLGLFGIGTRTVEVTRTATPVDH
jgi:hypothetical protein